jgi:hypothetical protein
MDGEQMASSDAHTEPTPTLALTHSIGAYMIASDF